jgi:hypothetical protein
MVTVVMALALGGVLSSASGSAMSTMESSLARAGDTWSGIWKGNDGGIYYMREDEPGGLVWLGLSADGGKSWSNVYNGIVSQDRNISSGAWVDVPIGSVRGQGELGLTRKDSNTIVAHRRTGGFGTSEFRRVGSDPLQNIQSAFSASQPGEPLTGIWKGNDGGTYYIREHKGYAGLRTITWVGLDSAGGKGKGWSNVFFGGFDPYDRDGKTISGPWTDVPRGSNRGSGVLRLRLEGSGLIVATDHRGFSGSEWRRVIPRPLGRLSPMSQEEKNLFDLVNDARTHPEKYPPNGSTQGAAMNPCSGPFQYSVQLRDIAREHNRFLASKPIDWVNTYPNMHTGPNGKLVWDAGEPMDRAGYHSFRSENVATGFATPAEVMRFWMQDDERFGWGHRNLILNCNAREAGIGHYQGGPGSHYWTLDVGTR